MLFNSLEVGTYLIRNIFIRASLLSCMLEVVLPYRVITSKYDTRLNYYEADIFHPLLRQK